MNKKHSFIGAVLMFLLLFTSCKEDINHPSEAGIPLASNIDVEITVDQEINQVKFKMKNISGCYPIWIFDEATKKVYSTVNEFTKIYSAAGTYSVEIKIGNANGVSDGSIIKEFTINNSLIEDKYIKLLAGDESKQWVIAKSESGHMSCGPSGTDGTEWWNATPNEKAAWGIYDDILTFTTDMNYTYNPGAGGTVYVNTGCTIFSEYNTNNGSDFMAPVSEQTTSFNLIAEGSDLFISFPSQTLFPYLPNDDAYNNPKYKLVSISSTKMELIIDNGTIAWHYILVSGNDAKPGGYDPDNNCNMWKTATFTNEFFYAPNWSQIADPELIANGNSYQITLPTATTDTWQAQVKFLTDMSTSSANSYDFSVILNSTLAHNNVTVKLVKTGDDDTFYFTENIQLKAYEDYTFIMTDLSGIDMENVTLVFDFGKNEAGTIVTVSRIVLKEHSCDDGTIIEEPEEDNVNWLPDSDCNLWKTVDFTNFFFYAPEWNELPAPSFTPNGNSYTIQLPEATFAQWQAQVHFLTENISTNAGIKYDFRCILNSNTDLNATIKLTKVGDNDTFFFVKTVSLTAYEDFIFKMPGMDGIDIDKINLVFDFGGNPANTEIKISSIILKEATCNN